MPSMEGPLPPPKDLSLPDSAVKDVPSTGDSGDCEGNQAKLSQVREKRLNSGFLEPIPGGTWEVGERLE